jgi:hypothetical protein
MKIEPENEHRCPKCGGRCGSLCQQIAADLVYVFEQIDKYKQERK